MQRRFDHEEGLIAIPSGKQETFEQLFRQYHAPLTYFAQSLVNDWPTAEDLVEETFLKLWERLEILCNPGSIKAWLYTTVRNTAIDHIRKVKRMDAYATEVRNKTVGEEKPIIHRIIEAETMHTIFATVQSLPPKCGQIFKMFYLEGKKLQEIAHELNLSISTVKSQKGRALEIIKRRLPEFCLLLFTVFSSKSI